MPYYDKLAYFDGMFGSLTTVDSTGYAREIVTTRAHPGRYIRIDDGRHYPQLCTGGGFRGGTLSWAKEPEKMGRQFAKDCLAQFFEDEGSYKKAVTDIVESRSSSSESDQRTLAG
jgi:hypothetical protein